MSEGGGNGNITVNDLDEIKQMVIIMGAISTAVGVLLAALAIIILIYLIRISKVCKNISFGLKTTRLDVRKTLDAIESAVKRNHVPADGVNDGSDSASPVFTRQIFTPTTPLPLNLSVLRESGEYELDRKIVGNNIVTSHQRKNKPPVPPRRAQSFYDDF